MRNFKLICLVTCATLSTLGGLQVLADDTEVFYGTTTSASDATNPNILLILDTSGSMTLNVSSTRQAYVPATTYSGSCSNSNIYYKLATDTSTPTCGSSQVISTSYFTSSTCAPGVTAIGNVGFYQDNAVQWVKSVKSGTTKYQWTTSFNQASGTTTYTSKDVTCQGNTVEYPVYAVQPSSGAGNEWAGTTASNYWTQGGVTQQYVFYSANYVRYLNDSSQLVTQDRMQIVQAATQSMLGSLSNVNVGLGRYNMGGNGGFILDAIQPLSTGLSTLNTAIGNLHACGDTPLSETLYEAYLYFAGKPVKYGLSDKASNVDQLAVSCTSTNTSSDSASRLPTPSTGTYKAPMQSACQQNYIVYLTDGLPNADNNADSLIGGLTPNPNSCYASTNAMWTALGVTSPPGAADFTDGSGLCLKALASYMYNNDLNTTYTGKQNVITYFIGFGSNVADGDSFKYLQDAAAAGGGQAYLANDADSLAQTLTAVIGNIQQTSATFTSPSVAVNSFNKTQVLEDMYVAMFKPSTTLHWPGNTKKFKLRNNTVGTVVTPMIVGQDTTTSAVDPTTGFFTNVAKDFWQLSSDTNTDLTTKGGAANVIPAPGSRNLYTYLGSNHPTSLQALSSNPIATSNAAITTSLLALGASPTRDVLINWARGDLDGDPTTTGDTRHEMGDPVHSQPAVVIYGATGATQTDKLNDATVYVATNDGYLHAFDVLTGNELWSYVPQELLSGLKNLYKDPATSTKHYALDGDIRVLRYDVNGNGVIDPASNDRVFLYVSQGRGGENYYALDVTDKNNPKFMWSLGRNAGTTCGTAPDDFSGLVCKSWSTPALGRIKVGDGSAQNSQRLVLIFAGGYGDTETVQLPSSNDSYGNAIYIVDAVKGTILWSQTKTATGSFANMTHAIPSDVTVLDIDDDGFTDRMYVGDMAGQIWRFDITNGNPASTLVAGGVIASLGAKVSGAATTTNVDNRAFYNAPDVAFFVMRGGSNFYNIAIGSGDRTFPKSNTTTRDCFYSIRDYRLAPLTQSAYDSLTPTTDICENSATTGGLAVTDGVHAPTLPNGGPGWKLPLSSTEKALAESTTVSGTAMFTTFLPGGGSSCGISTGSARAYAVDVNTGLAHFSTLFQSFNTTGLPTQISVVNQSNIVRTDGSTDPSGGSGGGGSGGGNSSKSTCLSGVTILGNCVAFGQRVKTFWKDQSAN